MDEWEEDSFIIEVAFGTLPAGHDWHSVARHQPGASPGLTVLRQLIN